MTASRHHAIQSYMKEAAARIDDALAALFPPSMELPHALKAAMEYSLQAGGKRIRPILCLAAAEALQGNQDDVLPVACALELIHTYSLIHDDLPAMDNDDYRRGLLTNHKVYGEAMAILAGDGLLTHAFHLISSRTGAAGLSAQNALRIIQELSWYAGPRGMVGGQAADIEGEQGITTLAQLEYIHHHKTSDLIIASLRCGGIAAGANEQQLSALEQFGFGIGMAFQIQDDVLDVIGDEQKLGKPLHSDEHGKKVTYPYFVGIDASLKKIEEYTSKGKNAIAQAGFPHPGRLYELADFLMDRDH